MEGVNAKTAKKKTVEKIEHRVHPTILVKMKMVCFRTVVQFKKNVWTSVRKNWILLSNRYPIQKKMCGPHFCMRAIEDALRSTPHHGRIDTLCH